MNLKVRLRNKTFWATAIPALITFIYTLLSCFDVVPSISEATIVKIVTIVISALTMLGVLVDPTTAGIGDSIRAMGYLKPFKDKKAGAEDDNLK